MVETRSQKRRKITEKSCINRLPDDVLLRIISQLNIFEAAQTSILSRRWLNLWIPNITSLNIAGPDFTMPMGRFESLAHRILTAHRAQTIPRFPLLENLKQMHLTLDIGMESGLRLFFGLFNASPNLCSLSLTLTEAIRSKLKPEYTTGCPDHKFLEEVKIDGFIGNEGELQLIMCIARSSPSLKKIVIRPTPYRDRDLSINPCHVLSVIERLPSKLPQKEVEISLDASGLQKPKWQYFYK